MKDCTSSIPNVVLGGTKSALNETDFLALQQIWCSMTMRIPCHYFVSINNAREKLVCESEHTL